MIGSFFHLTTIANRCATYYQQPRFVQVSEFLSVPKYIDIVAIETIDNANVKTRPPIGSFAPISIWVTGWVLFELIFAALTECRRGISR